MCGGYAASFAENGRGGHGNGEFQQGNATVAINSSDSRARSETAKPRINKRKKLLFFRILGGIPQNSADFILNYNGRNTIDLPKQERRELCDLTPKRSGSGAAYTRQNPNDQSQRALETIVNKTPTVPLFKSGPFTGFFY